MSKIDSGAMLFLRNVNRDCAVQKSAASGEDVGSPPLLQAIQVCVGEALLF